MAQAAAVVDGHKGASKVMTDHRRYQWLRVAVGFDRRSRRVRREVARLIVEHAEGDPYCLALADFLRDQRTRVACAPTIHQELH